MYEQDNFKHHYGASFTSLCPYEFMIELGPLIIECQIKKSQFYVASPHLLRLGEGGATVIGMDENVVIYRRYFGCRVFPTRYQQTIVDRAKNRKISVNIANISTIYRLWTDISDSKSVKFAAYRKMQKKNKKKNHFGLYIGRYRRYIGRYRPNLFLCFFLSNGQKLLTHERLRSCLKNSKFSTANS